MAHLAFELGGRLRLDVRDQSGERRPVRFRLLDAAQAEQNVEFEAFRDGTLTRSNWYVTPWAPNLLVQPLPPGRYELLLWNDDVPEQRLPVRVEAGQVTALNSTLER
jgi:hypothetical protein